MSSVFTDGNVPSEGATGRAVGIILGVVGVNVLIYLFNQNNIITRWCCCWSSSLFISNRAWTHRAKPHQPVQQFWAWDQLDAHHLYSGAGGSVGLLLLRLVSITFFVFTMIWMPLGPKCCSTGNLNDWMTYFTNWTFVLFGLQATLGTVGTLSYMWQRHTGRAPTQQPRAFNLLDKSFLLCLTTCEVATLSLTVFYWAVLYDHLSKVQLDDVFRHGVNAVLMLLDYLLSRAPVVSYHVQGPILFGTLYLIFMWGHWGRKNVWVYSALDWRRKISPAYYAAMIGLIILFLLILFWLACLREWLLSCCGCTRSRRASYSEEYQGQQQLPVTDRNGLGPHSLAPAPAWQLEHYHYGGRHDGLQLPVINKA